MRETPRRPSAVADALRTEGALVLRGVLPVERVRALARAADGVYARIAASAARGGPSAVRELLPPGCAYAPTASSVGGAALEEELGADVAGWLLASGALRGALADACGGPFVLDLDQLWLRRQYAPGRAPAGHAAHGWHQDGALAYDFLGGEDASEGLLPLVTAWIPLGAAGGDAPGVELLAGPCERVLAPLELAPDAVRAAFEASRLWTPSLGPGDVLLMAGGTLHRTHVTSGMGSDRTSLELRALPAGPPPARLAGERFSPPW